MKIQQIITALLVLSLLMTIGSCALLIFIVKLGYTNFTSINGKLNLITLGEQCTISYFILQYGEALNLHIKIAFISSFLSFLLSILVFSLIYYFICRNHKVFNHRISQQTGISSNQSFFHFMKQANDSFFRAKGQINALYIFLAIALLFSFIPLKIYAQIEIDSINSVCLINFNNNEILLITVLSIITFSLTGVCFILGLFVNQQFYAWVREIEGTSESYQRQMQRIIQQIPQSERILHQNGADRELDLQQLPKLNQSKYKNDQICYKKKEQTFRGQINQSYIKRVQSIIYDPKKDLLLQSVINHF